MKKESTAEIFIAGNPFEPLDDEKTQEKTSKLKEKTQKNQGKNSRFRQIHLVKLPKKGPISKPDLAPKGLQF